MRTRPQMQNGKLGDGLGSRGLTYVRPWAMKDMYNPHKG